MPETAPEIHNPVAHAYAAFLAREGFRPNLAERCEDGILTGMFFESKGNAFLFFAHENDPEFFRVGAVFGLGGTPSDAAMFRDIANDLNESMKCVKTFLDLGNGGVRFLVDVFLAGQPVTKAHVDRATSSIHGAAEAFRAARRLRERRGRLDA